MENKITIKEAEADFSKLVEAVNKNGKVEIAGENGKRYALVDLTDGDYIVDLTEDERFDIVTKRVLKEYLPALKALAK